MSQVTVETFYRRLVDSQMLTSGELDEVRADFPEFSGADDAHDLATSLVGVGRLTRFQARSLYRKRPLRLVYGNYLVLDRLGKGGMGVVFKARHRMMQRIVALKVLPSDFAQNEKAIARFRREVVAAANLSHPNVVTAFDADECHGTFYLAMEFVDGEDLASIVSSSGRPLSADASCDAILQAARGLEYAHSNGIIHRDIKPSNLLRDREGIVRILDMGLALIDESMLSSPEVVSSTQLTAENTMMGTVDFLAPEQAVNTHTADARSDMYALAASWYFLVAGVSPFSGETPMAKVVAHATSPVPSLRAANSGVTAEQEAVFQRMMRKKPDERFANMSEVVSRLAPLLDPVAIRSEISQTPLFEAVPNSVAETRFDAEDDIGSDQFETVRFGEDSSIELELASPAATIQRQSRRRDASGVVWMIAMLIGAVAIAAMAVLLGKNG